MPLSSRVLSCAALLAAVPSLAAPPKPAAPVTLRFAWPASFQAQVSEKLTMRTSDTKPPQGFTLRYPLKLEARKKERWVVPGTPEVSPPEYARVFQGLPTLVLDASGNLLRAEVPAPVIDAALKVELTMANPNLPADEQAKLRERTRKRLEEGARRKWDKLVGQWLGKKLRPGETEKRKSLLPSKVLPGLPVDAEERFSVEGPVPCEPGAAVSRCVRLRHETVADAQALQRMRPEHEHHLNEGARAGTPRKRITAVELRTTLELVTEPDTLIPHRLREETVDWVVTTSDPQPQPSTGHGQRSEQEILFTRSTP